MSKWIRKGDSVCVVAGNERGRTGKVLDRRGSRIVVESLNMRSKHVKKSQSHPQGAILRIEGPLHISNVALCDASGQKITVKVRQNQNGRRDLIYRQGEEDVVLRILKKGKEES